LLSTKNKHRIAVPIFFRCTFRFQELGLEKGWGDCTQRAHETIHLLLDLLEAPDPSTLEKFLGTIPMVFNVVILSPHGYFAQANVLGYPDTGGQVKSCIVLA
jgi:sucrose synthase